MKTFLIYVLFSSIGSIFLNDTPSDFERKLSNIASDFREKIMDKSKCEGLLQDASRVADDIDDELKKRGLFCV